MRRRQADPGADADLDDVLAFGHRDDQRFAVDRGRQDDGLAEGIAQAVHRAFGDTGDFELFARGLPEMEQARSQPVPFAVAFLRHEAEFPKRLQVTMDARPRHVELARQVGKPHRSAGTGKRFENLRRDGDRFDRAVARAVVIVPVIRGSHGVNIRRSPIVPPERSRFRPRIKRGSVMP